MKSICFHCQFVGIGMAEARCPECAHPLIMNMGGAALATKDLERLFARAKARSQPLPLPGVSDEPRQAQLLMERRKQRQQSQAEARRAEELAVLRQSRRRQMARMFAAASALALGLLVTLNLTGAL
jgi:hypothetical protein